MQMDGTKSTIVGAIDSFTCHQTGNSSGTGCGSVDTTVQEVSDGIHDAIEPYIAAFIEFGEVVPEPSSQVVLVDVSS